MKLNKKPSKKIGIFFLKNLMKLILIFNFLNILDIVSTYIGYFHKSLFEKNVMANTLFKNGFFWEYMILIKFFGMFYFTFFIWFFIKFILEKNIKNEIYWFFAYVFYFSIIISFLFNMFILLVIVINNIYLISIF